MKTTVISSEGNLLDSSFDKRFGRATWFAFYTHETGDIEFVENEYAQADHAAGTKVSELMVERKVNTVVSGDFGPKAKDLLERFNIQMVVLQEDGLQIKDIVERMKA